MSGIVYELSDFDLGWVVGIIEGEGHIAGGRRTDRKRGWRVKIDVASSDRAILERLQRLLGVGGIYRQSVGNKLSSRPCYCWRVQSVRHAQALVRLIYPHLSARRQAQARPVLEAKTVYGPGGVGRGNPL